MERLLTSPEGFGLVSASPLQRAICRAADGLAIPTATLDDLGVRKHFGCDRSRLGGTKPSIVTVVAGIRSAKSLIAGCAALRSALTADLSALQSHEFARVGIVAPTVDNAHATFKMLVGAVQASPLLSGLLEGEPTVDTFWIVRPDGRRIEFKVVAAHRGGMTLRSRWLAGFVLDEVALFGASLDGAAVSAEDLLQSAETRLLKGGQGWLVSSPFGPTGLLHAEWRANFGAPGERLVVHAPTQAMNPAFPVSKIEYTRSQQPDVAAREYDAQWVDADTALLDGKLVDASVRIDATPVPPDADSSYVAAWDAATRGNAWTLIVARRVAEKIEVSLATQWAGSKTAPLDPARVIAEIASILAPYRVHAVHSDAWSVDALATIAAQSGMQLVPQTLSGVAKVNVYEQLRVAFARGAMSLPAVPQLVADLKGIRKRASSNSIAIDLLKTPDGRHGDFAPALALVVARVGALLGSTPIEMNSMRGARPVESFLEPSSDRAPRPAAAAGAVNPFAVRTSFTRW
ncbi:MAG: hypothetical protein NVS3B10_00270 [Polyangiales bacterium]